ncbi:MAG: hypothetical protein E5X61_13350, partial [Mesorhizobium sp.]
MKTKSRAGGLNAFHIPEQHQMNGCRLEESRPLSFREDIRSLLFRLLLAVVSEREPDMREVLTARVSLHALADERR